MINVRIFQPFVSYGLCPWCVTHTYHTCMCVVEEYCCCSMICPPVHIFIRVCCFVCARWCHPTATHGIRTLIHSLPLLLTAFQFTSSSSILGYKEYSSCTAVLHISDILWFYLAVVSQARRCCCNCVWIQNQFECRGIPVQQYYTAVVVGGGVMLFGTTTAVEAELRRYTHTLTADQHPAREWLLLYCCDC